MFPISANEKPKCSGIFSDRWKAGTWKAPWHLRADLPYGQVRYDDSDEAAADQLMCSAAEPLGRYLPTQPLLPQCTAPLSRAPASAEAASIRDWRPGVQRSRHLLLLLLCLSWDPAHPSKTTWNLGIQPHRLRQRPTLPPCYWSHQLLGFHSRMFL